MKSTKFFALALVAVFLYACEKEQAVMENPEDESAIVQKDALYKGASSSHSFIVVSRGNSLPGNLENDIAAAGGTILGTIPDIGLALVQSDNPDFTVQGTKIKGIGAIVPNLTSMYLDPDARRESITIDAGNPPTSGDDDYLFDLQWGHDAIDAPEAWEAGYRGEGARVGILDTGFDLDHPDLVSNINFDLSVDMTGEGLQYTYPDAFSHGTHTAGTVAAADNAFGTIGIAPEAELVLIKVLYDEGVGSLYDILDGIVYAALVDCDVINMSIGSDFFKSGNPEEGYTARDAAWYKNIYDRAVTFAYQNGTTVIASAGNEATDYDHSADLMHLPSGAAHALSISATAPVGWGANPATNLDLFASYSNYGQSAIDFAAPGGDFMYYYDPDGQNICTVAGISRPCYIFDYVFSTGNNGWFWSAGTSMAAPHVTGVAALIIGKNGGSLSPAKVEAILKASADDLGKPGRDDFYGQGRVNAQRAVAL
jgi:subtilisin family serine protease